MSTTIALLISYLLGSLSSAIITAKILKLPDPRTQGSGNAGATNVLRSSGKKPAMYTVIGDILKGFIAVIIGRMLGVDGAMLGIVALAAVIGHIFPLYFGFKGGKGVATAIGGILGLSIAVGAASAVVWAVIAYITRYASLASLVAIVAGFIFSIVFGHPGYAFSILCIAGVIAWKHKDNIDRLRNGTESKIEL